MKNNLLSLVAALACVVPATLQAQDFCDLFDGPDEPLANRDWTVNAGDWNVVGGQAVAGPSGAVEQQAFAGNPPVTLPANYTISWDWNWLAPADSQPVGRHASGLFEFNQASARGDGATNGYQVFWIDRDSDRGLSLFRWDGGSFAVLNPPGGTGALFPQPPTTVRVEVIGSRIRVYGDDVLGIDVVDNTYRGGIFGLWTWNGAGQHVEFDNVKMAPITDVLEACCTSSQALTGCPTTFDASCSVSEGGGDIVRYDWDFGDGNTGSGATASNNYAAAGAYTVTLEIENEAGTIATTEKEITVTEVVLSYSDDFDRPDGPVDGWTVFSGANWRLEGNRVVSGPSTDGGDEYWIWAGDSPVYAPGLAEYEFDIEFLAPGTNAGVGRHGGFQFHCDPPTRRGGGFSGYFIDWIDRASDRGVRLTRYDNGTPNELVRGQGAAATPDPPATWRVVTTASNVQVYGDEVLLIDHPDSTYRGGFFGFWTWGAGQEIAYDNLTVTADPVSPCCDVSSTAPLEGTEVSFDASCSKSFAGDIVSYEWDFGDGTSAMGAAVAHTYEISDVYIASVTLTDSEGNSAVIEKTISVAPNLIGFQDCFERADGGLDGDGWSVHAGAWNIVGGFAEAGPTTGGGQAGEHQAFAGVPPGALGSANYSISFDWSFLGPADSQPVGRHAGVFFEFNKPGIRWAGDTTGYQLWWIDRNSDRGLTLARWDGGGLATLNPPGGTGGLFANPPSNIRIDVNGDNIKVYGDNVLAIDVNDGTYRSGIFGLWAWDGANQHVQFDNVAVYSGTPPDPCPGTGVVAGDCTSDGAVDAADFVCYVSVLFPTFVLNVDSTLPCPGGAGSAGNASVLNVNGDSDFNLTDLLYIANFALLGGPAPVQGADCFDVGVLYNCESASTCQ